MRTTALIVILVCLTASLARAAVEVDGYYWLMEPEGQVAVGAGGLVGTSADLADDLGYTDVQGILGVRLVVGDKHQFGFGYFGLNASADNEINRTIRFDDRVFPIKADLSSSLEADILRGFYRWNIGSKDFRGGLLIGAQYVGLTAETASSLIGSAQEEIKTGSPIIGVSVHAEPVPSLALKGSLIGISWDFGDVKAAFIDLELAAQYTLPPGLMLGVGYRHADIDVEDINSLIDLELTLSGPVLYVGFHW